MKKITLLIATFIFAIGAYAQEDITLTQNVGDEITASNSVGCEGGDNDWARNFILSDHNVEGVLTLESGRIGVQSTDLMDETVSVEVYATDSGFPNGEMELLGTQDVVIPSGSDLTYIEYDFDEPITVPAGTESIAVVVHQGATGNGFFIGGTAEETASAYLRSIECELEEFGEPGAIDFPDANFYITVTGTGDLSVEDFEMSNFTHFTQNDQLFVESAGQIQEIVIYNLLGQQVISENINATSGSVNLGSLNAGVYLTKVNLDGITKTFKFSVK